MTHHRLDELYSATEEELQFGVGLLAVPSQAPAPFIQVYYRHWSRQKLELVRDSFRGGLVLTISPRSGDTRDLHLCTRDGITIQATDGEHTSMLRAPTWDSHLEAIDEHVIQRFEANRQRCGG